MASVMASSESGNISMKYGIVMSAYAGGINGAEMVSGSISAA
jgi:hypothetical protein